MSSCGSLWMSKWSTNIHIRFQWILMLNILFELCQALRLRTLQAYGSREENMNVAMKLFIGANCGTTLRKCKGFWCRWVWIWLSIRVSVCVRDNGKLLNLDCSEVLPRILILLGKRPETNSILVNFKVPKAQGKKKFS